MPILQIFKLSRYQFNKYICHLLLLLSLYVSAHQSHERRSIKWKRASIYFVRLWHSGLLVSSVLIHRSWLIHSLVGSFIDLDFPPTEEFCHHWEPTLASVGCTNTTSSSFKHSHPLRWHCSLAETNRTCVFFQVSAVGSDFTQLSLKTTSRITWILRFSSHSR